jgi:hypothetical protein
MMATISETQNPIRRPFKSLIMATPRYFHLLEPEDQRAYLSMKQTLEGWHYNSLEYMVNALAMIQRFCIRHDDANQWKRCVVCGICWLGENVALNIRQLKLLMGRSKSGINSMFSKMGYDSSGNPAHGLILNYFPALCSVTFRSEERHWTIRTKRLKQYKLEEVLPIDCPTIMMIDPAPDWE